MRIQNLVKVHFDRRSERATPAWFAERFAFFQQWTLRSLQAQTFKDFRIWFHCDPGMEEIMEPLQKAVPDGVYTFQPYGCRPAISIGDANYVYVTRIDSDDLFAGTALAHVNAIRPMQPGRTEAAIFRRGYAHDVRSGRLGVYHNQSSPFHTLMFPREVFLDPEAYRKAFIGDHSMVNNAYPVQSLPDWQFTVLIHGSNFLSTFDYGRQREEWVERGWTPERFIAQPIVFDVDDFCDEWNCLDEMIALKEVYPNFKATLFTIPGKTSVHLLRRARSFDWLELAIHGVNHVKGECVNMSAAELKKAFCDLDYTIWTEGFRPPFWEMSSSIIDACNDLGLWIALHDRDKRTLGPKCRSGYYACDERLPASHHHSWDTCGNWVRKDLPRLKTQWRRDQAFSWVSESVLVPQR